MQYLKSTYGCIYLFTFLSSLPPSSQCVATRLTLKEISYPRSLSTLYTNSTQTQRVILFVIHNHLCSVFKYVTDIDSLITNLINSGTWVLAEFDIYKLLITLTLSPSRKTSTLSDTVICKTTFGDIHSTCSKYDRALALLWLIAETGVMLTDINQIYTIFGITPENNESTM